MRTVINVFQVYICQHSYFSLLNQLDIGCKNAVGGWLVDPSESIDN